MSEELYGGYTLQEIYDAMSRSTHGGEVQWDREREVATAALPDFLGEIAELTTLRAENERLRGQVADLINHANMLRSFLRSGEPMSAQDDDYHQSVIGEARAALQAGEK